jgi:hypothetical protein
VGPGGLDQKPGFARADLDFERSAPPEELLRDEGATDPRLLVGRDREA